MQIANEFVYNRKYSMNDVYKKSNIFKYINTLKFNDFNVFITRFLKDPSWLELDLKRVVVPVSTVDELKALCNLSTDKFYVVIYLKNPELLRDCPESRSGLFLMIDQEDTDKFVEYIRSNVTTNMLKFMSKTQGIVNVRVNEDNYMNIDYLYTSGFYKLPYFCNLETSMDFYSLRDLTLDQIRPIIYDMKLICYNGPFGKELVMNWNDLDKNSHGTTTYKFNHSNFYPYNNLFLDEEGIKFNKDSDLIVSYEELNNLSFDKLNKLSGIFSQEFIGDNGTYIDYEQNYKVNGVYNQLPYLNKIINIIMMGGDF